MKVWRPACWSQRQEMWKRRARFGTRHMPVGVKSWQTKEEEISRTVAVRSRITRTVVNVVNERKYVSVTVNHAAVSISRPATGNRQRILSPIRLSVGVRQACQVESGCYVYGRQRTRWCWLRTPMNGNRRFGQRRCLLLQRARKERTYANERHRCRVSAVAERRF